MVWMQSAYAGSRPSFCARQQAGYGPKRKYSVSAWMTGTYCMQTYSGWMQIDKYRY